MDYKSFPCEFKAIADGDGRTITGYASTFGPPADVVGDVVDKGAFKKTLREGGPPKSRRIKLLWMHRDPLGLPTVLREDDKGLYFEARISKTQFGDDALELIRDGVVDKMSIGYNIIKEKRDDATGYNHLKEVRLHEVSPVPFPANELTDILGVKHRGAELSPQLVVQALIKGMGFTVTESGVLVPSGTHEKRATRFGNLPLAARNAAWDGSAAEKRVREWADAEDEPNDRYARAFFWFDQETRANFGAYKLGFADVVNGDLVAIPAGIIAAAAALQGARGGVDIPDADINGVRNHITKYYEKMGREFDGFDPTPPWERSASAPEVCPHCKQELILGDVPGESDTLSDQEPPTDVTVPQDETPNPDSSKGDPDVLQSLSNQLQETINLLKGE